MDVVVRDVTGLTGIKIISDIGILDPGTLAQHRHYNCRKSEEEIKKALHSNEREDFIFGLNQEYERYKFYQTKIEECDKKIGEYLSEHIANNDGQIDINRLERKPHKRINKNTIKGIDLNVVAYQYFEGVDLFAIPGVSHSTVLTIMSEMGL